jgi:hypothetical protein
MFFNEAKVSDKERSRLYVIRRLGFCNSNLFTRMMKDPDLGYLPKLIPLNEDNPINDAAKYKKKLHERISTGYQCARNVGKKSTWMATEEDQVWAAKAMKGL